jgi:radical SAM superfamily enzyme YgiQ (UPF0313 family)
LSLSWRCCNIMAMTGKKERPAPSQSRADYFSGGKLAGEEGTVSKDWGGRYPFAFIYPNSYFVGMSNLGVQAIYQLLNDRADTVCERVFWENDGKPFLSLESSRPMMDYACLAFSFSYELDYLNLKPILRAAGIPLYARERDGRHPLLIAGGPCVTANPMPVSLFFDALCIGEAEVIIPEMLPIMVTDSSRDEKLKRLSVLPGVYVSSYHDGHKITRRWLADLNEFPVHSTVLTRDTELGDLYLIEVERGCSAACSFCLVSRAFCPLRFHSLKSLLEQAREGLRYRKRIGLVGPVVTDHPQIEELLSGILDMGAGFSLSSLRLKRLSPRILELMVRGGVHTLVLAPEAGSERLRKTIRKGFSEDDIMQAAVKVAEQPFKQLKLYFMLGLPTETESDVEEIITLALKCQGLLDKSQKGCRLSSNVAPFVPKAGTAFQRLGMADTATLEKRIARLRDCLSGEGIEVKAESPQWSHVQAALSRGDSNMAAVIADMDKVSLAAWRRAVKKAGVNTDHFVLENWGRNEKLPWDIIDLG